MNTNVIQMVLICSCQRVTINKSSDYVRIRILNQLKKKELKQNSDLRQWMSRRFKVSLETKWNVIKTARITDKQMVPKFHYYRHMIDLCIMLKMPIGLADDEGMEAHHRIANVVRSQYLNQRGQSRIKHSMTKMYVISSPKYSNVYTA
eukprot:747945_1